MTISRRLHIGLTMAVGALIIFSAGCGLFSKSKQPEPAEVVQPTPPPLPTATPAPPPPPPRPSGARIADEAKLQNLIQGKTTKADVRDAFGVPQEVILSPGFETFVYYREKSSGWISRTSSRVETLTIRFDLNGVLKDFEYRYSGQ